MERFRIEEKIKFAPALVILFPDARTTYLPSNEPELTKDPMVNTYRNTSIKLLERYRQQGYLTTAFIYADTSEEDYSYNYPPQSFSTVITSQLTFGSWTRKNYQDELLSLIPSYFQGTRLVVGGYHADDCVATFTAAARNFGLAAKVDLRLTDKFTFLLISHEARKLVPKNLLDDHRREDRLIWRSFYVEVENKIQSIEGY